MDMEAGSKIEGFELKAVEEVNEISSLAYIFEHVKTRAKLLFLKNSDIEKTFSITFRTPPYDHTGLPHILEHSVLCGSRKFPLKDPFAQLAKSTIQSFLNALTFSDKTVYPFSTINDKEFSKMMRVYLDAVFFPKIYDQKEIFLQEGWRYELENKESELKYNGIVYGEMKGMFSSAENILESHIMRGLFPDTCYGFESGGDPGHIVDLQYEDFLEFHKKYYHPSNSFICICGDADIAKYLKLISGEYLSAFAYSDVDSRIELQHPFNERREKVERYPVLKDDNISNKYHFGLGFALGKATEAEAALGLDILSLILMEYESSPIRKALIKSGIAGHVSGGLCEDIVYQMYFSIYAWNTKGALKGEFERLVFDVLKKLKETGIDRELIFAAINKKEFQLRELKFFDDDYLTKGMQYTLKILDSWLYQSSPLIHLKYKKHLKHIRAHINERYFENLLEPYFLKNNHSFLLVLEPDPGLDRESEVRKRLKEYRESLGEDDIQTLIAQTKDVLEFQDSIDAKEDVDKIETLSLNDIESPPRKREYSEEELNGINVFNYKKHTNGIIYLNFYFDPLMVPLEKVPYLPLLLEVLTEAKTRNYEYDEFSNLIHTYLGGLDFDVKGLENQDLQFCPRVILSVKVMEENFDKLVLILNELFNSVVLEDMKVKEVVKKLKAGYENDMLMSGHRFVAGRMDSYLTFKGKYNDLVNGIDFYNFIKRLNDNYNSERENLLSNLQYIYKNFFNRKNLVVSVASGGFDIMKLNNIRIKYSDVTPFNYTFDFEILNEGFKSSSQVNYVGKGFNYKKAGLPYSGNLLVLKNMLRYKYLWENIRVKGGAYGCIADINSDGNFFLVSYRDPNITKTLNVYDNLPGFLERFEPDEVELRRYIVGTISELDKPYDVETDVKLAMLDYFRGVTEDIKQKEREDILGLTTDSFRELSIFVRKVLREGIVCCIGNDALIKKDKNSFKGIKQLF